MATEKVVSYTAEQTAELVARYQAGEAVEAIALAVGKNVRSVIAKLAKEKVYVAKEKAKSGEGHMTKANLVAAIAAAVGLTAQTSLNSLEKATKEDLEALFKAVKATAV